MSRIYVQQYDHYWAFTPRGLRALLERGARGGEWNLDDYGKMLTRKPRYSNESIAIRVLDWTREDFADALEYLHEHGNLNTYQIWIWGC